jgi:hypothetical protein
LMASCRRATHAEFSRTFARAGDVERGVTNWNAQ